jgi:hypothetical protein
VNVVLEKRPSERSWDRREVLDDEIDVVQVPWLDWSPMGAKLRVDCQTASRRASKAMSEDCCDNVRSSTGIILVQKGREHGS